MYNDELLIEVLAFNRYMCRRQRRWFDKRNQPANTIPIETYLDLWTNGGGVDRGLTPVEMN